MKNFNNSSKINLTKYLLKIQLEKYYLSQNLR